MPLHAMQDTRGVGVPDADGVEKSARAAEFDADLPLTEAFRRMAACARRVW